MRELFDDAINWLYSVVCRHMTRSRHDILWYSNWIRSKYVLKVVSSIAYYFSSTFDIQRLMAPCPQQFASQNHIQIDGRRRIFDTESRGGCRSLMLYRAGGLHQQYGWLLSGRTIEFNHLASFVVRLHGTDFKTAMTIIFWVAVLSPTSFTFCRILVSFWTEASLFTIRGFLTMSAFNFTRTILAVAFHETELFRRLFFFVDKVMYWVVFNKLMCSLSMMTAFRHRPSVVKWFEHDDIIVLLGGYWRLQHGRNVSGTYPELVSTETAAFTMAIPFARMVITPSWI